MAGPLRMRWLLPFLIAVLPIAVVGPAFAAEDRKGPEPVTVVATDYQFAPDHLSFKLGVAYRLRIENHGKELHEFSAKAFFAAADLGDPAVLNPDRTEVAVHPGEAKELIFVPKQAGRYRLLCPDHDWTGMVGEITVE